MTSRDAFKDRERAMEEGYFRAHDARLLEKLRARATLGELALALRGKLQIDDVDLLHEIRDLGMTEDTGAALLLAPLVQVAWVDGAVTQREREAVLELAASRGIQTDSPAHAMLVEWLDHRPSDELFDIALRALEAGLSVLSPEERRERLDGVAQACKQVAMASGGIAGLFGLGGEISKKEAELLRSISEKLRQR